MANRQKKGRVKDRTAVTVYAEPEVLDQLDKLCEIERRSRGAMTHEILRRYFATPAVTTTRSGNQ